MESSFTDAEKRFVIAEMIKVSHVDVGTLVDFAKHHDVHPDWMQMQLPGGRNMSQCFRAAEVMFDMHFSPPVMPMFKRKSFGDINEQPPKRQAVMSPMAERQPYAQTRSFGAHNTTTVPPVNIQPRPSPNGYPAPSPSTSSPPVSVTLPTVIPGRKRGRPSKANRELLARNKAPQPGGYAPISPAPIAPSPAPPMAQQTYSPSPGAAPAYQVSPGSAPEPKPKKQTRTQAADKNQQTENVPRSVQESPEATDGKPPGAVFDYGWHDNSRRVDQIQAGNPGPVPLEPPIQAQRPPGHQSIHNPHTPVVTTAIPRTTVAAPVKIEHARAANQA